MVFDEVVYFCIVVIVVELMIVDVFLIGFDRMLVMING